MTRLVVLAAALVSLAGCAVTQVHIDYIDFVQLGGITYSAGSTPSSRPLTQADLGVEYGKVKVKLDGTSDPNHKVQDGDAAFLEPGTAVYRVNGYRATFRLAASNQGRLTLYESDSNPNAAVGADLLDLAGKVAYIGVNSATDGTTELAAIKDPVKVKALVDMVEKGPVIQTAEPTDALRYFIDFHMTDGTDVIRAYWPQSGELARGIHMPDAFRAAITAAAG